MSYYLRVEGMNLGNFVLDTNDLATIRGGSLLLLEAMEKVEEIVSLHVPALSPNNRIKEIDNKLQQLKHDKTIGKAEKNRRSTELRNEKKALKKQNNNSPNTTNTQTITKGASWGLFKLNDDENIAKKIRDDVVNAFNNNVQYKHATFMVDIYKKENGETYPLSRDKIQTLNRWQQLQSPSFSITSEGEEVCALDQVTPANSKIDLPRDDNERNEVYVSDSIQQRRDYGRTEKKTAQFYKKRKALPANPTLQLTKDLGELSDNPPPEVKNLSGKIAFIYIDGNSFGKMQKASKTEQEQRQFDTQTREGREKVLIHIIKKIKTKPSWLHNGNLRLETLLWGGDEIIWVVPAWQGWWMLNEFYEQAEQYIKLELKGTNGQVEITELFHGSSIIFCKHSAPIHRIDELARTLADGFAKLEKTKNNIAYQVLESFDHAGSNQQEYRTQRIKGLSGNIDDLLINQDDMRTLNDCVRTLKNHDFPKRKIYQIVEKYRNDNTDGANALYEKLIGTDRSDGIQTKEQKNYQSNLEKLKSIFNNSNVYWLHLMELWDYVGLPALDHKEGE